MKKFRAILALSIACLAEAAFAEFRVDGTAIVGSDFISSPSFNQAAQSLGSENATWGLGWELVVGHGGLGSDYLVRFSQDSSAAWWLDWNAQALYASYHFLGARRFFDPFVDAGLGCAGRVLLGQGTAQADSLAITVYPFVSAGASFDLHGLRLGAKLSYALGESAIPAASIPGYELGRFQAYAFAGFSVGGGRRR